MFFNMSVNKARSVESAVFCKQEGLVWAEHSASDPDNAVKRTSFSLLLSCMHLSQQIRFLGKLIFLRCSAMEKVKKVNSDRHDNLSLCE